MAAAGAVTVVIGAIVALVSLPAHLGLTHEQRVKHRAITLDPIDLNHQTLAAFRSEAGDRDAAALHLDDQGPRRRLVLAVTGDGALLAQAAVTGDASPPDPALPDSGVSDDGTDGSVGQSEPAPGSEGNGQTSPTPVPTAPGTTTTSPTVPELPTTPTDTTPTDTTPTPPGPGEPPLPSSTEAKVASSGVPIVIPDQVTPEDLQQVAQEVQEATGLVGDDCAEDLSGCPGMAAMIGAALTDADGRAVSVAVAVERLKRALPQMRRVQTPAGATVDGIGVDVTVHADDLKGATILVKWQLIERGRGRLHLYGEWLSANSMYRIVPPSDDDDSDVPLWVPWPPGNGRYGIRLLVYVDGVRFMHKDVPLES